MRMYLVSAVCALLAVVMCSQVPCEEEIPVYGYEVVNVYPHDPEAFTQGLVFQDGVLYEGTGRYGKSELRRIDLVNGKVTGRVKLPGRFFGEGIAIVDGEIVQLTWKSGTGFVYDSKELSVLRTFRYSSEGWGITYDRTRLIMSDGTSTLRFLNAMSMKRESSLEVSAAGRMIKGLNELEFVKGSIYANVWRTWRIAIISPRTGEVSAWIDLQGILNEEKEEKTSGVLNGISYDSEGERLFVTGKNWPKLFEIKVLIPTGTNR